MRGPGRSRIFGRRAGATAAPLGARERMRTRGKNGQRPARARPWMLLSRHVSDPPDAHGTTRDPGLRLWRPRARDTRIVLGSRVAPGGSAGAHPRPGAIIACRLVSCGQGPDQVTLAAAGDVREREMSEASNGTSRTSRDSPPGREERTGARGAGAGTRAGAPRVPGWGPAVTMQATTSALRPIRTIESGSRASFPPSTGSSPVAPSHGPSPVTGSCAPSRSRPA